MSETYTVLLLVEQAMTSADAQQVRSLHEELREDGHDVGYHVLLPVEDAAARIEAALGSVTTDALGETRALPDPDLVQSVEEESQRQSADDLASTLAALRSVGAEAEGHLVDGDPIEALAAAVTEVDGREAIILTRSHVVSEFFHVDWSSRARRKIGVPVLHLLEHETFDEQAGSGEGITGA